jgi:hypothetical protein
VRETVDRFPGPIAVADEETTSGLTRDWNGFPDENGTYAVVAEYDAPGVHQMAVKTFRPSPPCQPQVAVENTVTQIVYYLDRADVVAHPDKYRPDQPGRVETPGKAFLNANNLFEPLEGAVVTSVEVSVDGVLVPGTRTDVDSCSVLQLSWGRETVFCTGLPTAIDALALRTATPADLPAPTPQPT